MKSTTEPLGTLTTSNNYALVEPFVVAANHGADPDGEGHARRVYSADDPLGTIPAGGRTFAVCDPFVVPYYGTAVPDSVEDPLATINTRDRFGLVEPQAGEDGSDIRFRMLQPEELKCAMGFEKDYVITGTRDDQVKQIGNAVEVLPSSRFGSGFPGDQPHMKDTLDVLAVGQQAALTLHGIMPKPFESPRTLAMVIAVLIEQDSVRYRVAYWYGGRRYTAWVNDVEIEPHKDGAKVTKVRKRKAAADMRTCEMNPDC